MAITPKYIISLSHARAKLTELRDEVRVKRSEKLITKNGSSCTARIAWIITIG
jgi:PHD/YefM family antitoxin component YafN of YafNO toxin-antitoxin module